MANGRRGAVVTLARHHADTPRALRALITGQREIALGRLNNTQEVTLATGGATSTVVTIRGVRSTTVAFLSPQNANAAAGMTTTYAVCTKDTVTINHVASALTRTLRLAIFA